MSKKKKQDHSFLKKLILLFLLLLLIPLTIFAGRQAVTLFTSASVIQANIAVDADKSQANLSRPWQGLSQGGEQEVPGRLVSLAPVSGKIANLGTRYVRIDHVLEEPFNNTVQARVKEITDSGAIPMIALSYFPSDVAASPIGTPTNYAAWQRKVKNLIEQVSGKNNMNIQGVYYEVWNEPDGENFGDFDIGHGKDYFKLYEQTVAAAERAENVNDFKIGGPALADLRRCENGTIFGCQDYWLDEFLEKVDLNKVRLDFISWHRYSTRLDDYKEDVNFINDLYTHYSTLPPAEKIITEWGSVPERSPIHNTNFDAAHLVAAARTFLGHVNLTTKFEVRDGPDSGNQGWGILYHNGSEKPTYRVLELLNRLRTERVLVSGEGTNVTGIASKDSSGLSLILSNFDQRSSHAELVPIKIINLTPGRYRVTKVVLNGSLPQGKETVANSTLPLGVFTTSEPMLPNSILFYDFQLTGLLTTTDDVN